MTKPAPLDPGVTVCPICEFPRHPRQPMGHDCAVELRGKLREERAKLATADTLSLELRTRVASLQLELKRIHDVVGGPHPLQGARRLADRAEHAERMQDVLYRRGEQIGVRLLLAALMDLEGRWFVPKRHLRRISAAVKRIRDEAPQSETLAR